MAGPGRERVDEDDVALIDALHVHPRATFAELGAVLDVSAVTVGRRWRRLSSSGRAWVSSAPGHAMPVAGAVLEVTCVPGRTHEVARALAAEPQVFSVHLTSGPVDLYALVLTADMTALTQLLVDRLDAGIGASGAIQRISTGVMSRIFSGPRWRLGAISTDAAESLTARLPRPHPVAGGLSELDRALFLALQTDGRASYRALSARLDRTEQAIRRRLLHLEQSGMLTYRTDFVRPEAGWPTQAVLQLRVPDELLDEVGRRIGASAEIRVCAALVAEANLFATVQLHELSALEVLLRRIRATWPGVEVVDRRIVLRPIKSWGRLLDARGRAVETVPVNPWA